MAMGMFSPVCQEVSGLRIVVENDVCVGKKDIEKDIEKRWNIVIII